MSAIRKSSFAVAADKLPGNAAHAVRALYDACRQVDDLADELGGSAGHAALTDLLEDLEQGSARSEAAAIFLRLNEARQLDLAPARLLVTTVRGDLEHRPFETMDALNEYAQGVAGTVGLMMCDVFDVRDREARAKGAALGRAMQLTNIARDVFADAQLGRRYLPSSLCPVSPAHLATGKAVSSPQVRSAIESVLDEAETLYARGLRGLPALAPAPRLAVATAALSYRDIGRRIAAAGHYPPQTRMRAQGLRRFALGLQAVAIAAFASRKGVSHAA